MTNAQAWFNVALRPQKPQGSLGRGAQDGHLDSHTVPELWINFIHLTMLLYDHRSRGCLLGTGVEGGGGGDEGERVTA